MVACGQPATAPSTRRPGSGRRRLATGRSRGGSITRGRLTGWRFASAGSQAAYLLGAAELELQEAFAALLVPGDVVYDVGANVGFFTLLAGRLVTEAGEVHAFEPVKANVVALRHNLELNGVRHVTVVSSAVGDHVGTAQLEAGATMETAHLARGGEGNVTVPVTTLDAYAAADGSLPALVKIDVEGAEDLVIAGMRETLARQHTIVLCELHFSMDDPRWLQIASVLAEAGYQHFVLTGEDATKPQRVAVPPNVRGEAARRALLGSSHSLVSAVASQASD